MDILNLARQQLELVLENGFHCELHTLETVVMIMRQMFTDVQDVYARVPGDGHLCP